MQLKGILDWAGLLVDSLGVLAIMIGLLIATWRFLARRSGAENPYRRYRQDIGRAILLGLELLVAGDIIRTVAADPTLRNVAVLAGIVAIRTFLSVTLQVELEGRWPWQRASEPTPHPSSV